MADPKKPKGSVYKDRKKNVRSHTTTNVVVPNAGGTVRQFGPTSSSSAIKKPKKRKK